MIYLLDRRDYQFPDPASIPENEREDDGCIAIGGDLCPKRLIEAYSLGIFPWSDFRDEQLLWYCPMERFVIFPGQLHISHSLRTVLNRGRLQATLDRDFDGVIRGCAKGRIDQPGAWLGPDMIRAYRRMHQLGYAHSIEVWQDERLVGGLYGIHMLNGFMGESMFSDVPNASKVALVYLCQLAQNNGIAFIDCQFETPHLRSMGGYRIPYEVYMELLWRPADTPVDTAPPSPSTPIPEN